MLVVTHRHDRHEECPLKLSSEKGSHTLFALPHYPQVSEVSIYLLLLRQLLPLHSPASLPAALKVSLWLAICCCMYIIGGMEVLERRAVLHSYAGVFEHLAPSGAVWGEIVTRV